MRIHVSALKRLLTSRVRFDYAVVKRLAAPASPEILAFDTGGSFWEMQSEFTLENNDFTLYRERLWWVGLGDWECSVIPDNAAITPRV